MPICQTQSTPVRCFPSEAQPTAAQHLTPTLWNQLEPSCQERLAQQVAELIRRWRREPAEAEGDDHESS